MEMTGPRGSQTIEPGQSMLVRGDSTDPEFQQTSAPPRDQFDEWSGSRDAEIVTARSPQYIGGEVQGGEDLDRYGNWVPSPDYGQVWAPQGMPADWSPYSNGQWTYLDYYGWSWIGYEPWGWAPYHYGRWFWNTGIGWCWWPGLRAGFGFRWSPAMVSFFGFGGGLGWVALAPFELFHPWWGHGFGGWGAFHGGYDLQHFRNAGIRGGAITAGFNSFGGAGHRFSMASAGQIRSASLYRGSLPVSPNAASYRFADRAVNANPRLSQAGSRSFFSSNYRSAGSYNSGARSTAGSSGGGWQHFGTSTPRTQPQNFAAPRSGANAESGWHGFATPHTNSAPSYGGQGYGAPRNNYPATNYGGGAYRAPSASAPRYNYNAPTAPHYNSAPRYSAPAAPHYSAPRSAPAPHYSAPKNSGGGGHASSGGGHGGGHGGGGHHR
jgi:hypothetical protein